MKKRKGEKIPFFSKLRVMSKAVGSQNKLFKFGGRQDAATPTCAATSESPNRRADSIATFFKNQYHYGARELKLKCLRISCEYYTKGNRADIIYACDQ